jgi:precorrin isomerase
MKSVTATAIEALEKRRQKIAIDANLFKLGIVKTDYAERCAKKYDEINRAIKELKEKAKQ